MRHAIWATVAVFLCTLTPSLFAWEGPIAGTMDDFRPAIRTIAKGVAKVLKSRKEEAITVGAFNGPPSLGTAAGPGFKKLMIEELTALKVRVERLGTKVGLSGEYRVAKAEGYRNQQLQLEVKLTDDAGQPLTDLAAAMGVPDGPKKGDKGTVRIDTLSSPESAAMATGMTVDFDAYHVRIFGPEHSMELLENLDVIKHALENPTAFVFEKTELRASEGSKYGLQVLVDGEPRELQLIKGKPFVKLEKGETFRLRLFNRSSLGLSAVFTLDGVNSFALSEIKLENGKPKYTQWLSPSGGSINLAGWHINNEKAREFRITDFSESVAAILGSEGQLGAITVMVRASWPKEAKWPDDEQFQDSGFPPVIAKSGTGVGAGREIETPDVRENTDSRWYGRVRSVMTIRYLRPDE